MVLYRGAPQEEKELQARDFPGIYLTTDQKSALAYGGHVSSWELLAPPESLFDFSNQGAEWIAREFMREYGDEEEYDREQAQNYGKHRNLMRANPLPYQDNPLASLALYPNQRWVDFLKYKGYRATLNGSDIFVFDKRDLRPAAPKTAVWLKHKCRFGQS